jgi:hypothetical protein
MLFGIYFVIALSNPAKPELLITEPGVGYWLVVVE